MPSSLPLFDPNRHALPLPESFAALEAMRELLHERSDGKNLRFVEFALRFEDCFKDAGRTTPLQHGPPIVLARRPGAVREVLILNLMRYEVLDLTRRVWDNACTAVVAQAL